MIAQHLADRDQVGGLDDDERIDGFRVLTLDSRAAFGFDDGGVWFRDLRVTTDELERVRTQSAIAFGSCSFEEPIAS